MRGGDDDTTVGTTHGDGQLSSGGGGKSDVQHITAHAHQGTTDHVLNHLSRDTGITAYDNLQLLARMLTGNKGGIGCGKLDDVQRVEGIASGSANRSADTRNRFNQCHSDLFCSFISNFVIAGIDIARRIGSALGMGDDETYLRHFIV